MKKVDGIDIKKKTSTTKVLPEEPILRLPKDSDLEVKPRITRPKSKKHKHKHLNIGDENFINAKNFLRAFIFILVCIILGILFSQILKTRTQLLSLQDSLQKNLNLMETYVGNGDVEKSMNQLSQMQTDLKKSKLIAQAWGQDFTYFQYVPGRKSALTQKEFLLDSGYDVVVFTDQIKQDFGSLNIASSNSCMLNLNGLNKQLSRLVKTVNKKIAKYSRLSKGMGTNESNKIASNLDSLSGITDGINKFLKNDLPWLSGADGKEKDILIVFQNNGELRGASGGSLGSFGVAKFKDGCLQKIDFGTNIYKIDQAYEAKNHIDPPEEIKFLNSNWVMKDSGWSIDGPTAFATIANFYAKETGSSVSGIVILDATFFENLLGQIGSINLPAYNAIIDKNNFRSEIDQEVHTDYFKNSNNLVENEPKKILSDMMPIAMDRIFAALKNPEKATGLLSIINNSLNQKHLVMYFDDADFQSQIEQSDWAGKINSSLGDYLYVNNSNINGGKSSINVDETLNLDATISNDGKVTNKLNLARNYTKFESKDDSRNINFVRMAIPNGSQISNFVPIAGNFEQYWDQGYKNSLPYWTTDDSGKTVTNFWMSTKPSETSQAEITYSPNYNIKIGSEFSYQISLQKQPGALDDKVTLMLHYPAGFVPTNVKNYDSKDNSLKIKVTLSEDQNIKINFKKTSD